MAPTDREPNRESDLEPERQTDLEPEGQSDRVADRTPEQTKRWKIALTIFLMFAIPAGTSLVALLDSSAEGTPAPPAITAPPTPPAPSG